LRVWQIVGCKLRHDQTSKCNGKFFFQTVATKF